MVVRRKSLLVLVTVAVLAIVAAACSSDDNGGNTGSSGATSSSGATGGATNLSGELNGAGSTAQQAAMQAWVATLTGDNPDLTVNYDPVGSGAGREQFIAGGADFAGSDAYLAEGDELSSAQDRCGGPDNVLELPVYISPIAVAFNLPGVDSLNLTADTIAKIFNGDITKWNDPAIAGDNGDANLPDTAITPVHRSDDSGTTQNFTEYLSAAAPDTWTYPPDDVWPIKAGESAEGTSGVIDAVTNGEGTITYADASQAGDLGKAKVEVNGQFVEISAQAAADAIDASKPVKGRGPYDHAIDVNRTPQNGEYPIVLLSYQIGCTQYDDPGTAANVKALFSLIVSSQGQQIAAQNAGSAPISDTLAQENQQAIDAIQT
jgi:phosphate transport system substrate-binding protein